MPDKHLTATLDKIFVSERNTRQPKPTDPDVLSLAESLKASGQITDGLARPHPKKKGCYELAAGARRRVALGVAGIKTMNLKIREMTDTELDALILVENFQRVNPTPQAEAEVVCRLVEQGMTNEAIAAQLGQKPAWVARRKQLLKVIPALRKEWRPDGELADYNAEMMEFIGSLPKVMQEEIAENLWHFDRFNSRKELESHFARELCRLDVAPFDLDDPKFFNPTTKCGPGCATDSSKQKDLFEFKDREGKKDCARCMNTGCFMHRLGLYQAARYKELTAGEDLPIVADFYASNDQIDVGGKAMKVVRVYDTPAKKQTPNARKVIQIDATGALTVGWIKKEKGSTADTSLDKATKTPESKRKEGIEMLQGKRWLAVLEKLKKAVRDATLKNLTVPLDDLIATLGLPFRVQNTGYEVTKAHWPILDARKKGFPPANEGNHGRATKKPVPREEALWPAMQSVLLGLLPDPVKVSYAPNFAETYERVGAIISFDTAAAKKAADLDILPPKSWGKVDPHTLKPVK